MNRNIPYGLVFIVLFLAIILPDLIIPSKGIIFTLEEWLVLFLLFGCIVLFRNRITKIIKKLNQLYPWRTAFRQRVLAQLGILLLGTSILSAVIFLPAAYYYSQNGIPEFYQNILDKKEEIKAMGDAPEYVNENFNKPWQLSDGLLAVVAVSFFCLLLIFVIEETYAYLNFKSQEKLEWERLQKEQAQLKANVLSKQLDPHFMFNTLNVLSGLIYKDVDKSAQFIKELSKIYRYVLEQSEELVSTVEQEFQFLESYMFLLKIRFDDKIPIHIDIPSDRKNWLLPSMTLELLVENAIKHNIVDSKRPLHLNFKISNNQLIVKNNLQRRNDFSNSLGIGLDNLKKRLDLLGKKNYSFAVVGNEYVAVVPLINPEDV